MQISVSVSPGLWHHLVSVQTAPRIELYGTRGYIEAWAEMHTRRAMRWRKMNQVRRRIHWSKFA